MLLNCLNVIFLLRKEREGLNEENNFLNLLLEMFLIFYAFICTDDNFVLALFACLEAYSPTIQLPMTFSF